MVAAEGCGSERVVPVKPSGTGMGLAKVGSMEMDWMRKRFEPVRVHGCVVSEGHCSRVRSGRRTRVTRGSQSLVGGSGSGADGCEAFSWAVVVASCSDSRLWRSREFGGMG